VLDFGAFVEIEKGVEVLIHVSEFSDERVEDPKQFVKPGQTLEPRLKSRWMALNGRLGCRSEGRHVPRKWLMAQG